MRGFSGVTEGNSLTWEVSPQARSLQPAMKLAQRGAFAPLPPLLALTQT